MPKKSSKAMPRSVNEPQWDPPAVGFTVTDEMKRLFAQPGYLNMSNGGPRAAHLYQNQSLNYELAEFGLFGVACFLGDLNKVQLLLMTGSAPHLANKETQYEFGYASLIVTGSQRVTTAPESPTSPEHLAILNLLISRGLPVSLPDFAGYTALHHCVLGTSRVKGEIMKKLIASGADVNYRNRWGETPLHDAIANDDIAGIDMLMEHGANVDLPDGNGLTVRVSYLATGKAVTAAMEKWLLKRSGKAEAPLTGKTCDHTALVNVNCKAGDAWKSHKTKCKPFTESSSITFKPCYPGPRGWLCPNEPLLRGLAGVPPTKPVPDTHLSIGHFPANLPPGGKQAIVKIQVPPFLKDLSGDYRPMLVYTQKRDFSCILQRLYDVIRRQTVSALKGYFIADIKSMDRLIVKASEPLATQPW